MMGNLVQEQATIALDEYLTLHCTHHSIRRAGAEIPLSELEWKVLEALIRSGRTLSTNDLLEQVWHDRYGDPRHVWAVIGRLCLKLEPDPRHPRYVRRNRSFGYWLALPCHERGEDEVPPTRGRSSSDHMTAGQEEERLNCTIVGQQPTSV